jgi:hypothetical protein
VIKNYKIKKTENQNEATLGGILMKAIENWFSRYVEREVEEYDVIPDSERKGSIALVVIFPLFVLYFIVHQMWSTGFFTASFGTLEIILLYGSLIGWIVTGALEGSGRKNLSRNFDAFGGLYFVTFCVAWLFVVFPFEFTYFADVLPDFLRFLVQWISNDIARVLMVLLIILYLILAVYSTITRVLVRKALADH